MMRRTLCGALGLLCVVSCTGASTVGPGPVAPAPSVPRQTAPAAGAGKSILALPPDTPLLAQWVKMLGQGKAPDTAGPVRLLTPQPLPGVVWSKVSVAIGGVNARLCEHGREVLATIDYSPGATDSAGHQAGDGEQTYLCSAARTLARTETEAAPPIRLLDSPGAPRAVLLVKGFHAPGRAFVVRAKGGAVEFGPADLKPRPGLDPLWICSNQRTGGDDVGDLWTAATVASLPPDSWYQEGTRGVRIVGPGLVVAGLSIPAGPGASPGFGWLRRPLAGGRWTRRWLRTPSTYLSDILPGFLGKASPPGDPPEPDYELWKDGSIIWQFTCEERQGLDEIHCVGLAMQPPNGSPRLLAWAVYDDIVGEAIHAGEPGSVEEEQAGRALSRVWFPTGEGIDSVPSYSQEWVAGDFRFDVDWTNNAVIYMLGGRLWAVDMSKVSRP